MKKQVAVIGAGIVGATAAYYLTKQGFTVTVFDEGVGQATSAAAGIICPWLSKRRNKDWYRLAAGGARFYQTLVEDVTRDGLDASFYSKTGAVLLKKSEKAARELLAIGEKRREDAPEIGKLTYLGPDELLERYPTLQAQTYGISVEGGAYVDGAKLVSTLLSYVEQQGGTVRKERVTLQENFAVQTSEGTHPFDHVLLTVGAWLPQLLEPIGYDVSVRPQKGQLIAVRPEHLQWSSPAVLMPEGEIDILPQTDGSVWIGASHENDKGYDLTVDTSVTKSLQEQGAAFFPALGEIPIDSVRIGTRAYTPDFSPFFGRLDTNPSILVASGLGSSGLTTGVFIGYQLSKMVQFEETNLATEAYIPSPYVSSKGGDTID